MAAPRLRVPELRQSLSQYAAICVKQPDDATCDDSTRRTYARTHVHVTRTVTSSWAPVRFRPNCLRPAGTHPARPCLAVSTMMISTQKLAPREIIQPSPRQRHLAGAGAEAHSGRPVHMRSDRLVQASSLQRPLLFPTLAARAQPASVVGVGVVGLYLRAPHFTNREWWASYSYPGRAGRDCTIPRTLPAPEGVESTSNGTVPDCG
jgi:hypothetical protein